MPVPDPARRSTFSRRGFLAAGGVAAFAGLSVAALDLPFFEVAGAQQDPMRCTTGDVSASDPRLIISNWTAYIDPRNQADSTLATFTKQTGIEVDYNVDVNDNADFYAKVKNQLGSCEPIDRDLMMLTDWMAARMIGLGWVQPMDKQNVPNLHANIIDSLRDKAWDPDLEYHAPWQSGLTGIAYNAAEVDEVGSFEELLTRPDLTGRVTLLSEMYDTMGFMLLSTGAEPGDFTADQWGVAIERLRQVVSDGQVRSFAGNNYLQELSSGNTLACEAWSGDVIQAQLENPDIKFVAPEEGMALWSDNMMLPNLSTHRANAEKWIDYYYEPEVAAELAAWVNYICPVQGAQEAMTKIAPKLAENTLIFPDAELLRSTWDFKALDDQEQSLYEREWADVTTG